MSEFLSITPEILLVEPDEDAVPEIQRYLELHCQAEARVVPTGEDAIAAHLEHASDIVLASAELPDMHFSALATKIIAIGRPRFILLTEEPQGRDMILAMRAGVHDVLVKPVDPHELSVCVEQQFEWRIREIKARRRTRKARTAIMKRDLQCQALKGQVDMLARDITNAYARLADQFPRRDSAQERKADG